jgi:mono/diheme cytochrome c family protein
MLLVPDTTQISLNYRIIGNDATRITIDTNFGALNLAYAQAGKTFGISYGKLVRQTLNNRSVKFFNKNGSNSFADADPVIDGVCQVCHTQTSVFNQAGALNGGNHPENKAGTNNPVIPQQSIGGLANCWDCHGARRGNPAAPADCPSTKGARDLPRPGRTRNTP